MMILPVSDARRPVAIESIELYDEYENAIADALADKGEAIIKLIAPWETKGVVYLDQYGKKLENGEHKDILAAYFGNAVKGYNHGIKVKLDNNGSKLQLAGTNPQTIRKATSEKEMVFYYDKTGSPTSFGDAFQIKLTADMDVDAQATAIATAVNADNSIANKQQEILKRIREQITELSTTLKFSIVECSETKTQTDVNNWDNVDKEKNVVYKVVPVHQLSGYSITKLGKQEIVTDISTYANFESAKTAAGSSVSGAAITDKATGDLTVETGKINPAKDALINAFSVTGKTKDGKTVIIPNSYYHVASGSAFSITKRGKQKNDALLEKVGEDILYWKDLYDENTAKGTRRDTIQKLAICIQAIGLKTEGEPVSQNVTISDGMGVPSEIRFYKDNWTYDAKDMTFLAANTVIEKDDYYDNDHTSKYGYGPDNSRLTISQYGKLQVHVLDQYGKAAIVKDSDGTEKKDDDASSLLTDGRDLGKYIEYTVSDIKENTGDFAHLASSSR